MTVRYLARTDTGLGPVAAGHVVPHAQFVGLAIHHTVMVLADYDRDGYLHGDLDDIARYMRQLKTARPDLGPDVPYCLAPDHRVLTHDLRWVPLGDLVVGDDLMAFTDLPTPRWSPSTVEQTATVRLPGYRVIFADGTEFVATAEHRWLTMQQASYVWRTTDQLWRTNRPAPTKIVKLCDPWRTDVSRDAGYLAGMWDADGHLIARRYRSMNLTCALTQLPNEALTAVEKMLVERGADFAVYDKDTAKIKPLSTVHIRGGMPGVMRFLGETRPPRLLRRWAEQVTGPLGIVRKQELVPVDHVEYVGPQDVVTLATSTGTLVVEGFGHHNSFVVFEGAAPGDAILCEGRGLGRTGAHTQGHNSTRYGIAIAGNTDTRPVTPGMLDAIRVAGLMLDKPGTAQPTIGHFQVKPTACPGTSMKAHLATVQPPFMTPPTTTTRRSGMQLIRKQGDTGVWLIGLPAGAVDVEGNDLALLETIHGRTVDLEPARFDKWILAAGGKA